MKALALMALGAAGVWWLSIEERKYAGRVAMDPGICKDPKGPTHYVTRSEMWDLLHAMGIIVTTTDSGQTEEWEA